VGAALVTRPDTVVRPDGVIHGIKRLVVPWSVQEEPNRHRRSARAAPEPAATAASSRPAATAASSRPAAAGAER
jgi:hypothetical protein